MNLTITKEAVADFGWNFEEYKGQLQANMEKYKNLVITDTNYKESKEVLASLGKQEKIIKEIEKQFKTPFKSAIDKIGGQAKELIEVIDEVRTPIKSEIGYFIKQKEDEKRSKIEEIRAKVIEEYSLEEKYGCLLPIKDTYVRESTSIKKATDGLKEDAEKLKEQQNNEKELIKMHKEKESTISEMAYMQSEAFGLKNNITFEEVKHLINKDMPEIMREILNMAKINLEKEKALISDTEVRPIENTVISEVVHVSETEVVDEEKRELILKFNMTTPQAQNLLKFLQGNKIEFQKVELKEGK